MSKGAAVFAYLCTKIGTSKDLERSNQTLLKTNKQKKKTNPETNPNKQTGPTAGWDSGKGWTPSLQHSKLSTLGNVIDPQILAKLSNVNEVQLCYIFFWRKPLTNSLLHSVKQWQKNSVNLKCHDMILFTFMSFIFSDKCQKGVSFNSEDILSSYVL